MCLCSSGPNSSWPKSRPQLARKPAWWSALSSKWHSVSLTVDHPLCLLAPNQWTVVFLKEHPPQQQHELTAVISLNLSYTYVFDHGSYKKITLGCRLFFHFSTSNNFNQRKNKNPLFNLWKVVKTDADNLKITVMFGTQLFNKVFQGYSTVKMAESIAIRTARPHLEAVWLTFWSNVWWVEMQFVQFSHILKKNS